MNDFLKNLRNTQRTSHQRFPGGGSRKEMEGNYLPGKDRRKLKDRRTPNMGESGAISTDLMEMTASQIQDSLSIIADSLEKLITQNELLVNAKVDQAQSMDQFFNKFTALLDEKLTQFLNMKAASDTSPSLPKEICISTPSPDNRHTKDEVIAMIRSMRKKKATFSEIAKWLDEEGIPTFSGRGEWHAQTIHRLCKG